MDWVQLITIVVGVGSVAINALMIFKFGPVRAAKLTRELQRAASLMERKVDLLRRLTGIRADVYNLNISRYVSVAQDQVEVDLNATHTELDSAARDIVAAAAKHNRYLKQLGLPLLPSAKLAAKT